MIAPLYYSRLSETFSSKGGNLPHWSQRCATFTTFRLADSLPKTKFEELREKRKEWLSSHISRRVDANAASCRSGDPGSPNSHDEEYQRHLLSQITETNISEYQDLFTGRLQALLDAGYGACWLRDYELRRVVEYSFQYFADVRYSLYAYVVMPNHVHVLFMPEAGYDSRRIVADWKRFSARIINARMNRRGAFWQKESYDHLVRDVEEFNAIRAYIRGNNQAIAYDVYK